MRLWGSAAKKWTSENPASRQLANLPSAGRKRPLRGTRRPETAAGAAAVFGRPDCLLLLGMQAARAGRRPANALPSGAGEGGTRVSTAYFRVFACRCCSLRRCFIFCKEKSKAEGAFDLPKIPRKCLAVTALESSLIFTFLIISLLEQ